MSSIVMCSRKLFQPFLVPDALPCSLERAAGASGGRLGIYGYLAPSGKADFPPPCCLSGSIIAAGILNLVFSFVVARLCCVPVQSREAILDVYASVVGALLLSLLRPLAHFNQVITLCALPVLAFPVFGSFCFAHSSRSNWRFLIDWRPLVRFPFFYC